MGSPRAALARGATARARRRLRIRGETAVAAWGHDDVQVLWNGIEIERYATAEPAPSAVPAVVFVGRHEQRKGLAVLLDSWDGIDRDAVLWVVGTGPQTDELRAHDVPGVVWLGRLSDAELESRLRGATVFCAPSLGGESFGVVLLEAMAAGTPIVASAIDGYENVARPDREALLVPPDDVAALRAALRQLLDDEEQRASSGEGRERPRRGVLHGASRRALRRAVRTGTRSRHVIDAQIGEIANLAVDLARARA